MTRVSLPGSACIVASPKYFFGADPDKHRTESATVLEQLAWYWTYSQEV